MGQASLPDSWGSCLLRDPWRGVQTQPVRSVSSRSPWQFPPAPRQGTLPDGAEGQGCLQMRASTQQAPNEKLLVVQENSNCENRVEPVMGICTKHANVAVLGLRKDNSVFPMTSRECVCLSLCSSNFVFKSSSSQPTCKNVLVSMCYRHLWGS